jgi:hypothetical protein
MNEHRTGFDGDGVLSEAAAARATSHPLQIDVPAQIDLLNDGRRDVLGLLSSEPNECPGGAHQNHANYHAHPLPLGPRYKYDAQKPQHHGQWVSDKLQDPNPPLSESSVE